MKTCTIDTEPCDNPIHGKGLCARHYSQQARRAKGISPRAAKAKESRPCAGCGRSVRPRHTKLEDFPGTVMYGSATNCITCHKAARAGGYRSLAAQRDARNLAYIAKGLESYLDRRRARIAQGERAYGLAA